MENLQLNGLNKSYIAYLEAKGLAKCFDAYAENCSGMSIFEIGFNNLSGYVYIALEDERVTICSQLGADVEYMYTDFDNGEETFYETYEEAIAYANRILD